MTYSRARRLTIICLSVGLAWWLTDNLLGMLAIELVIILVLSALWPDDAKQHSKEGS